MPDKLSICRDNISPYYLKRCVYYLCKPFYILPNRSLYIQTFPVQWLSSFLISIFKSEASQDIKNDRPISLFLSTPKPFEKLLVPYLLWHCNGIFDMNQHGFVTQGSTVNNLLVYERSSCQLLRQPCNLTPRPLIGYHSILISKLIALAFLSIA